MSHMQVRSLADSLSKAITLITAQSESSIHSLMITADADRQQLWEWNKEVPAAVERCVHDLFAEQAQARPDAPAICAWDGELTYGELDALSTKLAGHLVELGVKAEDMVPLCFEKSSGGHASRAQSWWCVCTAGP
jgi:non-ribosomal peptide synthetase component F